MQHKFLKLLVLLCFAFGGCTEKANLSSAEYLERATFSFEENKPYVASIEVKNALIRDPSNLGARWLLARIHLTLREGVAAETQLDRLTDSNFNHPDLLGMRLHALMLQGKYTEVIERATKSDNTSMELALRANANIALADILSSHSERNDRAGYLSLANSDLSKALQKDAENQLVYFGLARLALREKKFDLAKTHLSKAEQLDKSAVEVWNLRGVTGQLSGDYSYAEDSFEQAARLAPYDLLVNLNYSRVLVAQKKGGEALSILEEQLRIHPDMPTLNYLSALAHVQGGAVEKAANILNGVIKDYPNYADAQLLLGMVLAELGQYGQSEVALNRYLEFFPEHEKARNLLAKVQKAASQDDGIAISGAISGEVITEALSGRFEKGLNDATILVQQQHAAEIILADRKKFVDAPDRQQRQVVQALSRRGEYQKIIDLALARAQSNKDDPQSADWAGLANLMRGDFESARLFFDIALKRDPNFVSALNNLADLELRMNNLETAKELFDRALVIAPAEGFAKLGNARLAMLNGDFSLADSLIASARNDDSQAVAADYVDAELAIFQGDRSRWLEIINRLRERDLGSAEPDLLLARYYGQSQELEKALDVIIETEKKFPTEPELNKVHSVLLTQQATLALQEGHQARAIEAYEKAIELLPENDAAINGLAWLYQEIDHPNAFSLAERAFALNPESAAILDTLGWIILKRGDNERAERLLAKAVELAPNAPDIRYHWAESLIKVGKIQEATTQLGVALETVEFEFREDAEALEASL